MMPNRPKIKRLKWLVPRTCDSVMAERDWLNRLAQELFIGQVVPINDHKRRYIPF